MTAQRTPCRFTVKEYDEAHAWILVEEYEPGIGALKNKSLGLEFPSGTPFEEVRELASVLNKKLKGIVLHEHQ
jgi:hypothetical protein